MAILYSLLASSSVRALGACVPASAGGAGWIHSDTEVVVLSAANEGGLDQPVMPAGCTTEWGVAVAEQVRGPRTSV